MHFSHFPQREKFRKTEVEAKLHALVEAEELRLATNQPKPTQVSCVKSLTMGSAAESFFASTTVRVDKFARRYAPEPAPFEVNSIIIAPVTLQMLRRHLGHRASIVASSRGRKAHKALKHGVVNP